MMLSFSAVSAAVLKIAASAAVILLSFALFCARERAKRARCFFESFASLTTYAQLDALEASGSTPCGVTNGYKKRRGTVRKDAPASDPYQPDRTESSLRAAHFTAALARFYGNSFEEIDFPSNVPQFWGLTEVQSVALLQRTRAPGKMQHFCDDSDLCLNFYISYGRVAREELAALGGECRRMRWLSGLRAKDFEGQLKEFTYRCDAVLARFERHWLRCDVMNCLEFPREFQKWQRRRFWRAF